MSTAADTSAAAAAATAAAVPTATPSPPPAASTTATPPISSKRTPWKFQDSDIEIIKESLPIPGTDNARPLLRVHFSNRRTYFETRKHKRTFDHKFAEEEYKEAHSREDPNYETAGLRMENTIAVQATPKMTNNVVQTPKYRHVDSAIQVQPVMVDARLDPDDPEPASPDVMNFLNRVLPRLWHYLTLNVEIPLFLDDFQDLTDEDAIVGNRDDSNLKEFGTYQHHRYTSGQMITGIDWQPKSKGIVALAIAAPVGNEERHYRTRLVNSSLIVIWNFADPIHPLCVLESPVEIACLRFNPTANNLIVGGGFNGQVLLWDLAFVLDAAQKTTKKNRNMQQQHQEVDSTHIPAVPQDTVGVSYDEDGDAKVIRIQPKQISKLEAGHKRCVSDLWWFQDTLECTFEGRITTNADEKTMQFATVSNDGCMCIWDIRPDHIRKDKLRKLQQSKKGNEILWIPLLKIPLSRHEGGDLMASRFVMEGKANPYLVCAASEEGEFAVCNWCPEDDKILAAQTAALIPVEDMTPQGGKPKIVKQCNPGHFGPAWSIQRHPQKDLADYYLTTGDWGFKIWKLGVQTPIVNWVGEHLITCGRWSPTRPAVVFLGTNDGVVQVWDLLDKSHEPAHLHPLMGEPVTSLEFKPVQDTKRARNNPQLVAIGTRSGHLHVLELPSVFQRAHTHELKSMKMFLDREVKRVQYYTWRWKEVDKAKELERAQDNGAGGKKGAGGAGGLGGGHDDQDHDGDDENEFKDEIKFNEARLKFLEMVHGPGMGLESENQKTDGDENDS